MEIRDFLQVSSSLRDSAFFGESDGIFMAVVLQMYPYTRKSLLDKATYGSIMALVLFSHLEPCTSHRCRKCSKKAKNLSLASESIILQRCALQHVKDQLNVTLLEVVAYSAVLFYKAFDTAEHWLLFCKLMDDSNTTQC